ncbi:MAG: DUF3014 domain-containing protein [bacterium]|nr:DUF3014 domain-containing protein [bacterium]
METYRKVIWGSIVLAVVLIAAFIVYFFIIKEDPSQPPSPPPPVSGPVSTASESPVKKADAEGDPSEGQPLHVRLDESDGTLRELLKDCSPHPGFGGWLKNKDMIRRFVAVVDNIARGESPASHLPFLVPRGKFKVVKQDESFYIAQATYRRYDAIADIISSFDGEKLVELYARLKPLAEEAYKELGYPDKKFNDTLLQAISVLLNTPVPGNDILLREKVTAYAFDDPGLENLGAAQKHLLRMGPKNAAKIKAKLKEIVKAIRGGSSGG